MSTVGKPKTAPVETGNTATGGALTCVVSKDTHIEGNFSSEQDVRLDGTVKGDVRCTKRLVIGETGKVIGKVFADSGVIMGRIEGEVSIKDTLLLKSSAVISGNLQAKAMQVEEGAQYSGECKVGVQ